jgi:hypothetical protein
MQNTQLQVSYYVNADGSEWLAISDDHPRFALRDKSEIDLERQVQRALSFYAENRDEIERKVACRRASYADWQNSSQIVFSGFSEKNQKVASLDYLNMTATNGLS